MVQTPQWVHDAIFYQIFPDRFAVSAEVAKPTSLEPWNSPPTAHGFKGGDLLGVAEHLDYLQDLGITAIYFNPVFRSTANHRYHTHDYLVVDPILGGDGALATLLDEAHNRNMRVILDGVFNHASRGFYQFSHLLENGQQSPYLDWFKVRSWPLYPYGPADLPAGYDSWWNERALPTFNVTTPAVREFLLSVAEYWVKRGIDGWRLDVPNEIDDDEFWRDFRRRVKAINPEAYIVGEIWDDARRWLAGDQFDGVMNYPFTRACLGFFAGEGAGVDNSVVRDTGLQSLATLGGPEFRGAVDWLLGLYPWEVTLAQLNLLGSHDTPRFLTIARGDESSLRLATLFQMTFPGAPCIYYGDEVGLQGGRDPDCRRSFPWEPSAWNEDLRGYIKRCIALRSSHPVFRRGTYVSLCVQDGLYVFGRQLDRELAIIALNASRTSATVDVALPQEMAPFELEGTWESGRPEVVDEILRGWYLAPRSGAVVFGRKRGMVHDAAPRRD